MNLKDFKIEKKGDYNYIDFNQPAYANLQSLLNEGINSINNLNFYIDKIHYLLNNWDYIDIIVDIKYNGYWDWEVLAENNFTEGNYFTFLGQIDLYGYINADTKIVFIASEFFPDRPLVEMPLQEFVAILEQWRDIELHDL